MTSIGIIGAGQIGQAIATALARARIPVTLSNSRAPESLAETVAAIGAGVVADTREEASRNIVFVAVNWSRLPTALDGLPDFAGRIVVDANNSIEAPLFKPFDLGGRVSTEIVSGLVRDARVVKAFNHLPAHLLAADPTSEGGRRVLFYSGDDANAKSEIGALIERLGFFGIDLGPLSARRPSRPVPGRSSAGAEPRAVRPSEPDPQGRIGRSVLAARRRSA